jgi:rRNA maturation endonuclease Nob1
VFLTENLISVLFDLFNIKMSFLANPGFCAKCGSILPLLRSVGGLRCYTCKENYEAESKFCSPDHII